MLASPMGGSLTGVAVPVICSPPASELLAGAEVGGSSLFFGERTPVGVDAPMLTLAPAKRAHDRKAASAILPKIKRIADAA